MEFNHQEIDATFNSLHGMRSQCSLFGLRGQSSLASLTRVGIFLLRGALDTVGARVRSRTHDVVAKTNEKERQKLIGRSSQVVTVDSFKD